MTTASWKLIIDTTNNKSIEVYIDHDASSLD